MVFEVDRLRLVTADDVAVDELPKALPEYPRASADRPAAARRPPAARRAPSATTPCSGRGGHRRRPVRPIFWQPYDADPGPGARALAGRSRPCSSTTPSTPTTSGSARRDEGRAGDRRFLPVMARQPWVGRPRQRPERARLPAARRLLLSPVAARAAATMSACSSPRRRSRPALPPTHAAVLASLAVAFPTLIAFNLAPSATFFNQAAAFIGWGGFLLVLGAGLAQSARPRSRGSLALLAAIAILVAGGPRRLGLRRRALAALALVGRHAARRPAGAGDRRLRRPRRARHLRLSRLLHRPGRRRRRQQRDRPDPGAGAAAGRRRLDRRRPRFPAAPPATCASPTT